MWIRSMLICLLAVLLPSLASATTYWVSTAGGATLCSQIDGDEDPGAYMTYTALDTNNCAGPGDTVMFKAGTYTGAAKKINLLFTGAGSAAAPDKVLCEGNQTCILQWGLTFGYIVYIESSSNFVFGQDGHGFKVNCTNGTSVACGAVGLRIATNGVYTNITTEGNYLTGCSVSCYHEQERQPDAYFTNNIIRKNKIDALVADLSTTGTPHPIYVFSEGSLIEYNDTTANFGYALHGYHLCFNSTWRYNKVTVGPSAIGFTCRDNELGRSTNVKVYGNVFKSAGGNACIRNGAGSKDIQFYNNVCDGFNSFIDTNASAPSIFKNNVCTNGNCRFYLCTNSGSCSITATPTTLDCGGTCSTTNPTVTAASHFRNTATYDYSLISGSSLINSGISTNGVRGCNGTCDIGAYETFAPTSASIDASSIAITFGMNVFTPPVFTSGTTGWSVNCTGTGCGTPVVSGVSLVSGSTSQVRLTISGITGGACAVGQTWTWSYNSSTGTVTDSSNIAGASQRLFTFSTQATTNACTGTPPDPPANIEISYKFDEGTGTTAADDQGTNEAGTLTGGATWAAGHTGSGVSLTASSGQYVAVPYGSGVNPTTQSLSIAFGVFIAPGNENLGRSYFGAAPGTNQFFFITSKNGSWCIGVQTSGESNCNTAVSVTSGWNRLFLTVDSGADTVTLCKNGITATGPHGTKAYTSYTFASNFELGRISGVATGGGGIFDDFRLWTSVVSCADDYLAWEPPAPPVTGTFSQVAHQFQKVYLTLAGAIEDYGAPSATVKVIAGGAVALMTQVDCTGADCQALGVKQWYTRDGGTAQLVPDTMTSDEVAFYGQTTEPNLVTTAATCCITGALTANSGTTRFTSDAEVFDIAQNGSYTRRVMIKFGPTASGTYCFKERSDVAVDLSAYTPSGGACVTITPSQMVQ